MRPPSPVRFERKNNETSGGSQSVGEVASQISDFTCDLKKKIF